MSLLNTSISLFYTASRRGLLLRYAARNCDEKNDQLVVLTLIQKVLTSILSITVLLFSAGYSIPPGQSSSLVGWYSTPSTAIPRTEPHSMLIGNVLDLPLNSSPSAAVDMGGDWSQCCSAAATAIDRLDIVNRDAQHASPGPPLELGRSRLEL